MVEMIGGILLGLLLPRASVYEGLMPFGVGLVASVSGPGTVLVYLASMIGYLTQGSSVALRYIAASAAVVGMRWAASGFQRVVRSVLFAPCITCISLVITGSALLLGAQPQIGGVLTIVAESILGGGFAYFTSYLLRELPYVGERAFSERGQISAIVLLSVSMVALLTIEFSGISPGRIVCGLLILLAARCARLAGGASMGILMSVAIVLATPDLAHLSPAFALGGILAALFTDKGKWISSLLYLAAMGIATVQARQEVQVVIGIYEAFASCILFLMIPTSFEAVVERAFLSVRRLPEEDATRRSASMKLQYAAQAMQEVVGTVDSVSNRLAALGAPDIGSVCEESIDTVCGQCKHRVSCWDKHFTHITDALHHTLPKLRENGSLQEQELTGYLATDCRFADKMCMALNEHYKSFLLRESAYRRLYELRSVINDQFDSMATMLTEFSEQFTIPEWQDIPLTKQIRKVLEKENADVKEISCQVGEKGEMKIEMVLNGNYQPHDRHVFRQKIGHVCGRVFALPITEYAVGITRICLTEQTRFYMRVGTSQLSCKGESLCGDAFEVCKDGFGGQLIVLSDGMGSGGRASVDSAMTAGLATRLWKAGFGYESSLRMINTALVAKSEDESLATLDLLETNLYNGEITMIKAGAGVSLLYSNGRVSYFAEPSLPLGILRELSVSHVTDRLVDGDVLLIMSDGVSNEGVEWIEDLLNVFDKDRHMSLDELAETIAAQARERQGEDPDDITVIVTQLIEHI
ncbi:MAG: SpoIIE family protein phosphatase [Clostridia bacterium]|nr:SpoIIE family protein phosphatase [Clostridia bacterium]